MKRPKSTDLYLSFIAAIVVWSLKKIAFITMMPCMLGVIRRKKEAKNKTTKAIDEKVVQVKAKAAVDKVFFAAYFIMSSIVWYMVIKDKAWLPWYLGGAPGNVSVMGGFTNMPFTPMDE